MKIYVIIEVFNFGDGVKASVVLASDNEAVVNKELENLQQYRKYTSDFSRTYHKDNVQLQIFGRNHTA